MLADNTRVTYIGPSEDGLEQGDQGRVLTPTVGGAHVLWLTGARRQDATLVWEDHLVPTSHQAAAVVDSLDDSLDVGTLSRAAARTLYDQAGPVAVLNALSEAGHLAGFAAIADEALTLVAARIRTDPSIRAVAGQLDEDEAEEVYRLAAAVLVRDAFAYEG